MAEEEQQQGSGEEEGGAGEENGAPLGPRDEIKISVKRFQKSDNDQTYIYDIEVEVNGQAKVIHREYREILWLYRYLQRRVDLGGYILPPVPAPPPKTPDPKVAILGESSRALYGDQTRLPCMAVEIFLQSLADHRFFSENEMVRYFLTTDKLPTQERLGAGTLWSHFTKAFADYQLSNVKDTDDCFATFLAHIEAISPLFNTAAQDFSQMVAAYQNLACCVVQVGEALGDCSTWDGPQNRKCSGALSKMVEVLEESRQLLHAASLDSRHSLGFFLDLHHCFCEQAKEMMYRRLQKLHILLTCTQQLDKAKPEKKEAAETAKANADHTYQIITEAARKEVELFKEHHTQMCRSSLVQYVESQVSHCKQTYANLAKLKQQLENPPTPASSMN